MNHSSRRYWISFEITFKSIEAFDIDTILINNTAFCLSDERSFESKSRYFESIPFKEINPQEELVDDQKYQMNSKIVNKPNEQTHEEIPCIIDEKVPKLNLGSNSNKLMYTCTKFETGNPIINVENDKSSENSANRTSIDVHMMKNLEQSLLDDKEIKKIWQKDHKALESSTSTIYNDEYLPYEETAKLTHKIGLIKYVSIEIIKFLEGEIKFQNGNNCEILHASKCSKNSFNLTRTNKLDDHVYIKFKIPFDYSSEAECLISQRGNYSINPHRFVNDSTIIFDSPKYNSLDFEFNQNKIMTDTKSKLKSSFRNITNKHDLNVINEELIDESNKNGSKTMNSGQPSYENEQTLSKNSIGNNLFYDSTSRGVRIDTFNEPIYESCEEIEDEIEPQRVSSTGTGYRAYTNLVSSIREFSVKTKHNRDSLQHHISYDVLKDCSDLTKLEIQTDRSRQKLRELDVANNNSENYVETTESILRDYKITNVPSLRNLHLISSHNQKFETSKLNS